MNRKIGILRGINVGGKRKILMVDLKSTCEKLGLKNVTTYIQSGNLIFNSDKPNSELENELEKAITEKYGFDVPVIVRTEKELENSINNNPFFDKDTDIKQLHLTFLKEKPNMENLEKILTFKYEPDKFQIEDKDAFIFCAEKYHESKLTNNFFEKQLKVGATTRNWKTVMKLSELSKN
ncbi:uncharacterized protein (DUF1697 family) [Oceanihabitans sediminis]|uniref:DUF1697 domain-containing protein n=1 Tax=Oceanihabitans sediminis TaxID=1812012 RepID=A0A368P1I0_9FLAO|nr:DUF1697 domain-containing protein [Oceanihabitans sediminis]MDX1774517.1 DUF1697 domain-containing protein [Oceanihabitans sediminis]RBP25656.1 uncharacterized protein (DUF1697 family) [Oceanihabitans sediminis]RCU56702.1 DUF1697 domain-containing protein [Oceanihabitans sediminis]